MVGALQRGKADRRILQVAISVSSPARRSPNALRPRRRWPRLPAAPRCIVAGQLLDAGDEDRRQHGRIAARNGRNAGLGSVCPIALHQIPVTVSAPAPPRRRSRRSSARCNSSQCFGKGVSGLVIARSPRWSRACRQLLAVLDDDAHRGEFVADAVGFLEILSRAGGGAVRNQSSTCFASTPLACCLRPFHAAATHRTGSRAAGAMAANSPRSRSPPDAAAFRRPCSDSDRLRRVQIVDKARRSWPADG